MGTTKSIGATTPAPLLRAEVQNNKVALSDIPRRLSANAAWMAGYLVGGDELDAWTPNPAPRSPMTGLRGHTHSGGLDGRAIFRTLASFPFDNAYWRVGGGLTHNGGFGFADLSAIADGEAKQGVGGGPIPFYVPGCDPELGAYKQLAVRLTFDTETATNVVAGDVLTWRIDNTLLGVDRGAVLTGAINGASQVRTWASATKGTDTLETRPGEPNAIQITCELLCDATAGTRVVDVQLLELELGVFNT